MSSRRFVSILPLRFVMFDMGGNDFRMITNYFMWNRSYQIVDEVPLARQTDLSCCSSWQYWNTSLVSQRHAIVVKSVTNLKAGELWADLFTKGSRTKLAQLSDAVRHAASLLGLVPRGGAWEQTSREPEIGSDTFVWSISLSCFNKCYLSMSWFVNDTGDKQKCLLNAKCQNT